MIEIIAEIGQNHNGDMSLAKEMVSAAKENGADAVKFQVYDANKIFTKENNPWYEYSCKTELSQDDIVELSQECNRQGIEFIASAFDVKRVGWLEDISVKRHKIASRSIDDKDLLDAMIKTKKPLIVSLGMWDGDLFPDIETSAPIYYLYCISKYPARLEDLKFKGVDFYQYSGFSDHTVGIEAAMIAMSRGAQIIEKHFTLDKNMYGPDHKGSMVPEELLKLSKFSKIVKKCLF